MRCSIWAPILQRLGIAGLLAFILSPVIRRLRLWGLWRTPAAILTVLGAIALLSALSATMVVQITQLADDLPKYQANLSAKVRALSGYPMTSGALERASRSLRSLEKEIATPQPAEAPEQKPVPVEVRQPEPRGMEAISSVLKHLMAPLATTGLVVLFLVFILLQREDLRDRFLRLAGAADLQRTTEALDDAGSRLSRYFLAQTLLNVGFGTAIGLGLWAIGIPNPVLWGMLAAVMRFVPYIGGFIAAFFPVLLATAIDPGWTMVALTVALFAVAEPVAGHVVEPVLYGQHTGMSPAAVVIATLFWTMLWGPVGLPILSKGKLPDAWQVPYPVLCIASRSAIDEAACIMLAQILEKHGIGT